MVSTKNIGKRRGAQFKARLEQRERNNRPAAKTGYQREDSTWTVIGDADHGDGPLSDNLIYARRADGVPMVVYAAGYSRSHPNIDVELELSPNGFWQVYGLHAPRATKQLGTQAAAALQPDIRFDQSATVLLGGINFLPGRLRAVTGLEVTVEAFAYIDSNGDDAWWAGADSGTVTLSPPAAAGGNDQRAYIRVWLDNTAGAAALGQTAGTPILADLDLTIADAEAITTPAGMTALWDINLATGNIALPPYAVSPPYTWIDRRKFVQGDSSSGSIALTDGAVTVDPATLATFDPAYFAVTDLTGDNAGISFIGTADDISATAGVGGSIEDVLGDHETRIDTLEAGTTPDASVVTYTPASGSDPGNVDDALDNLRSRVTTIEGGGILPGAGSPASIFEGRLSLSNTDPYALGSLSNLSTIYLLQFNGLKAGVYASGAWGLYDIAASPVSLSVSGFPIHQKYDCFTYINAGAIALDYLAWNAPPTGAITGCTNASPPVVTSNAHGRSVGDLVTITGVVGSTGINTTSRISAVTANTFTLQTLAAVNLSAPGAYTSGGTWVLAYANSTRATAITTQDGIEVLTGDPTRRFIGSFQIGAVAGQLSDDPQYRFLWNKYNPVMKSLSVVGTGGTYSLAAAAGTQEHNNNFNFRGYAMLGEVNAAMQVGGSLRRAGVGATNLLYSVGFGSGNTAQVTIGAAIDAHLVVTEPLAPSVGLSILRGFESAFSGTITVYGQDHRITANIPM